jgi:microcystin-dependent protein
MATIAITKGYNDPSGFTSGETVTPAKLNSAQSPTAAITFVTADDTDDSTLEVSGGKFRVKDGGVTLAKLVTAVQQALLPAGAVQAFAMNSAPAGWLAADGSNVNRTTYAALFSAIGTTYGAGDGSTTFALPDLRGYFVRGSGTNSDATASGTFGVKQADDFKSHSHTSSTIVVRNLAPTATSFSVTTSGGNMDPNNTVTTTSVGGTETRPKNIAMLYCIKF